MREYRRTQEKKIFYPEWLSHTDFLEALAGELEDGCILMEKTTTLRPKEVPAKIK